MVYIITLTLILIMPPDSKDIEQSREMPSLSECFDLAKAWGEQNVEASGGVGFASGCSVTAPPGQKVQE